jgi:hypothetical protein
VSATQKHDYKHLRKTSPRINWQRQGCAIYYREKLIGEECKMNDTDLYIQSVNDNLKSIVKKLRGVIIDSSKEFKEEMKWNVPTYSINKNICSIMAHTHHVNFQIFQGANFKDSKLLYGTGKSMRHLRFENIEQMDITILKKIIKQAIIVDEGKNGG